jgi:putative endonuclease
MTNDLMQRIIEHYLDKHNDKTFAGRCYCYWLIYYEDFETLMEAIDREKEIKKWRREKKEKLINSINPSWKFINFVLFAEWPPNELFHRRDA